MNADAGDAPSGQLNPMSSGGDSLDCSVSQASNCLCRSKLKPKVAAIPISSNVKLEEVSGTDDGDMTTMPSGTFNPEMKRLLIVASVLTLYNPTVLSVSSDSPRCATNKFSPDIAMPLG